MKQIPIAFGVPRIGACVVCDASGRLNARICRPCEERHGRRTAELLARARADRGFAEACFQRLRADERARFVEVLGVSAGTAGAGRGHGIRPGLRKCGGRRPVRAVPAVGG